jgi:DNA polymerase-3 subunit delta'
MSSGVGTDDRPAPSLFAQVVGQPAAVADLRAAAARPVHAYLFVGPAGNGGLTAAHAFAAALLCADGGCGTCATCLGALSGRYSDLHLVRRSGAGLTVDDARRVVSIAQRRPLESARQVVIVLDAHLGERAAPALLKTLEEPPGETIFILLADQLIPDLVTVASRCVQVSFPPVERAVLEAWLVGRGVSDELAAVIADSSSGSPGRAQVMADDPEVAARAALWASVPDQLDGAGAAASALVRQLIESTDRATEPLRAENARQLESLTAAAKEMGERALPGRKDLVDQHAREERRWRTDALRAGLGALARVYRQRAAGTAGVTITPGDLDARAAIQAVGLITEAAQSLPRNPNESLLLQSLLVRLGALAA